MRASRSSLAASGRVGQPAAACATPSARAWPAQRRRPRASPRRASATPQQQQPARGLPRDEEEELRSLIASRYLRPDYDELSDEQVDELVEAAAGLISVLDDLRPLDPASFNGAYEIWKAIAAVPPPDRVRILDELEPGAIFSLWKATVGRYALDSGRGDELYRDHCIWDDFPGQPGQVFTYEGTCEQFFYRKPAGSPLRVDADLQSRFPRATPWLKPAPAAMAAPQDRFRQQFFLSNRTGLLHSRVVLTLPGAMRLFNFLLPPIYNRVEIGLALTPSQADAGADACLTYPASAALLQQQRAAGAALSREDLPSAVWPAPPAEGGWSPFSFGAKDYMRAAGPGFYVGCAYRTDEKGDYSEEDHVYFALVRRH